MHLCWRKNIRGGLGVQPQTLNTLKTLHVLFYSSDAEKTLSISALVFGAVASDGKGMPSLILQEGLKIDEVGYLKILQIVFYPWINKNYDPIEGDVHPGLCTCSLIKNILMRELPFLCPQIFGPLARHIWTPAIISCELMLRVSKTRPITVWPPRRPAKGEHYAANKITQNGGRFFYQSLLWI